MREIGHFIGGKTVAGTSGRSGDVFNPNTGEVQAKVAFAKKAEMEQAIANAEAAQPAWAATNPQRRARVLFKFLELAQKEFDSLAQLLSSEHGKTVADSKGDIAYFHGNFIPRRDTSFDFTKPDYSIPRLPDTVALMAAADAGSSLPAVKLPAAGQQVEAVHLGRPFAWGLRNELRRRRSALRRRARC